MFALSHSDSAAKFLVPPPLSFRRKSPLGSLVLLLLFGCSCAKKKKKNSSGKIHIFIGWELILAFCGERSKNSIPESLQPSLQPVKSCCFAGKQQEKLRISKKE